MICSNVEEKDITLINGCLNDLDAYPIHNIFSSSGLDIKNNKRTFISVFIGIDIDTINNHNIEIQISIVQYYFKLIKIDYLNNQLKYCKGKYNIKDSPNILDLITVIEDKSGRILFEDGFDNCFNKY